MRRIVSVVAVAAACAAVALGATPTSFQPVWPAKQLNAALTAPWMAPNSDTLLVGGADGSVRAYNAGTGTLNWSVQIPLQSIACTPIELSTGDVLAVTSDGTLYTVSPPTSDGIPFLKRIALGFYFANCTPVVDPATGFLFVSSRYYNDMFAVDTHTWKLLEVSAGTSNVRIGPSGLIWVGGYGMLHGYDLTTDRPTTYTDVYSLTGPPGGCNRPELQGSLAICTSDIGLYVVNVVVQQSTLVGPPSTRSDGVLLPNNLLVYGSDSAELVFAAPLESVPRIVDSVALPSTAPVVSTPAVVQGTVVVVTADGGVFGVPVDAPQSNGNRTVTQALYVEDGMGAFGTPAVSTKYGAVYVTTTAGGLHALRIN